jgi:hypothetical protein
VEDRRVVERGMREAAWRMDRFQRGGFARGLGTALLGGALLFWQPMRADAPHAHDTWKFDIVYLKKGQTWQGLLVKETETMITLLPIQKNPGERTKTRPVTSFSREEIDHIDKLDPKERAVLSEKLEKLKPANELLLMESLKLKPVPWGEEATGGLSYTSDDFILLSNASEEIVRRAAVRLEQIYAAYGRLLPHRRNSAKPTTIRLVKSLAEFQGLLKKQGIVLLNPAFYDPAKNEIVCASDLDRLAETLKRLGKENQQLAERLNEQEAAWKKAYGVIPPDLQAKLQQDRQKIKKACEENEKTFHRVTENLFQMLYHEAFHAYLANFVYRPGEVEVPRWLNEGLAQIFETAILEAGELRADAPDPKRLAQAKLALRKQGLVPLIDLLRSGPEQFLVNHAGQRQLSDRYYLTSWALAYYLAFQRKLLGTPELDSYLLSLKKGADSQAAFVQLVGQPLREFEMAFEQYLRALHNDGSLGK